MRRVVITGIGIVSSIGNSPDEVLRSLKEGRSGVEFLPERKEMGFYSSLSGTLKNFSPPDLSKKYLRNMGHGSLLAVHAATQAIADAGLSDDQVRSERTGVVIGNTGNFQTIFEQCSTFRTRASRLRATAVARAMASSVSANLSVLLGSRGHTLTVSTACASGATALGHGCSLIRSGLQDTVICGGSQELSWETACQFDSLRAFSKREEEPTKASRPFDKDREGFVPSGGSGIVVLEEYERACARGAKMYAEIAGFATNSDGYAMTTPSGEGSARCMELALRDARLNAEQIDYVNAHAASTKVGDAVEAKAIAKVLGGKVFVSATKSMTGHELGAAGSNEVIYTVLMMGHRFIAANINVEEIDEECRGINLVCNEAIEAPVRVAMSNAFAFGGVNASVVLRECEPGG